MSAGYAPAREPRCSTILACGRSGGERDPYSCNPPPGADRGRTRGHPARMVHGGPYPS